MTFFELLVIYFSKLKPKEETGAQVTVRMEGLNNAFKSGGRESRIL